jgi:1,4-alpha-glucan branching enzyme
MINEFHKSGIHIVMDVVYNHVPVGNGDVFGDVSGKYLLPNDIPELGAVSIAACRWSTA